MKNLISLVILISLFGCGKDGNKKSNVEKIVNAFEADLKLQRGLVAVHTSKGTMININWDLGTMKAVEENTVEKRTVLKVDGMDAYIYVESKDLIKMTTTQEIRIENSDMSDDVRETVKKANGTVSGSRLNFSMAESNVTSDIEINGRNMRYTYSFNIWGNVNLKHAFCEVEILTKMKTRFEGSKDIPTSLAQKTTCGALATTAEMKAVHLNYIEVCDERNPDEIRCENRDMSFLTADL